MPKTRLISPGSIPNHRLLKNLQLNDNYISNDGGDEGISIDNDGETTISAALKIKELSATPSADGVDTFGHLWVLNQDPTQLYFTNDDGDDIQLTSGDAAIGTIALPADRISVGDAAVSIATSSGDIVFYSNASSGTDEWLTFKTGDGDNPGGLVDGTVDNSLIPVTEILGKNNQRLRIRGRGAEQDVQIHSGKNIQLVPNAAGGSTSVALWKDRTATAAEYNLSGAWEASQSNQTIAQLADQTSPAAQFRGSTSGTLVAVYYETDGSGVPTFGASPESGGKNYTGKITIAGASYDSTSGTTTEKATITHSSVTLAQYQSVTGTGIPTGAYVGSITDSEHFVIHREGAVVTTTGGDLSSQTLYARDRVVFQDGGDQSTYAILEVERIGNGMIQFGISGSDANGQAVIRGYIDLGIDTVGSNIHLVANERLKLMSDSITNNAIQIDSATVFLSGTVHSAISGQDFTFIHGGDRMLFGNSACNTCDILIDSTTDTRKLWLAASSIANGTAKLANASDWQAAGGLEILVANETGATNFQTRVEDGQTEKQAHMSIVSDGDMHLLANEGEMTLNAREGDLTIETSNTAGSDIILDSIDKVHIDKNTSGDSAENSTALHVDLVRTVATSGTNAHNDIGIDLDVTSASLGTSTLMGMDIDVVGAGSGTSTATGVNITVGSADTNYALITAGGNVGLGVADPDAALEILNTSTQLKLSYDATNYATYTVAADGALTITTEDPDGAEADIILNADGNVGINVVDPDHKLEILTTGDQLKLSYDSDSYATFSVLSTSRLLITTGESGDIILDSQADITLEVGSNDEVEMKDPGSLTDFLKFSPLAGEIKILKGADYFQIDTDTNAATTISTVDFSDAEADLTFNIDGFIDINSAASEDITLDAGGGIILDSATGAFAMKGAGTTSEFSVANSAYAGMILGYRMIGEDTSHQSYTMTNTFAVPDAGMTVRFIAPPSGSVEVMVQVHCNTSTSGRIFYFGLSDNATYNTLGAGYEQIGYLPDETDDNVVQHYWTITGLTAGDTYNYWFGAKISATTGYLNWGGTSSGRYCDFIMKVTALPTAVSDFAVYG